MSFINIRTILLIKMLMVLEFYLFLNSHNMLFPCLKK